MGPNWQGLEGSVFHRAEAAGTPVVEGEMFEQVMVEEEARPCSEASEGVTYFETWELDPVPLGEVRVLER